LIAEAEKARFWKRLTVRRAANMIDIWGDMKRRRKLKGKEEIPVKEIGRLHLGQHGFRAPDARLRLASFTSFTSFTSFISGLLCC
jgi:hypothetical protein